ncbi:MAG: iron-containing alcohol dehydrogenase [Clostridia bacterium]|nr:iron-containing alcohol dehydrogenase [Clostridia bacterium]
MSGFMYYTPTKVVFGKDAEAQVGALVAEQNARKVLLHHGGGSVVKSGLLNRVKASLTEAGVDFIELGGAVPNPRLSLVYRGIELCRSEDVDFLLAVGGGSTVDSAKAIAFGAAEDGDVWDLFDRKRQATACLPVGVVLTLAATGSEMSDSTVITNEDGWIKRGYGSNLCRPVFAVMNPDLTKTLPDYQTACGCTDILMHTMERYFVSVPRLELTDSIAEALMRTVIHYAGVLKNDPQNDRARAEIMWAGSLSHNDLTGSRANGGADFSSHALEHELGGVYDVAHGAGLAAVWGSWARYVYRDCLPRFKKFAVRVMGVAETGTDEEIALKGIEAMEGFFRSIGMPISLAELGIHPTDEELKQLAHKCSVSAGGAKGSAKVLHEADMLAIYRMAL